MALNINYLKSLSYDKNKIKYLSNLGHNNILISTAQIILADLSYDDGKIKAMKIIVDWIVDVNVDAFPDILKTLSYDPGKNKILKILAKVIILKNESLKTPIKITVPQLYGILKCFSYDDGKVKATNTFIHYEVDVDLLPKILSIMSYDTGRNKILPKLTNCITTKINVIELGNILENYDYDDNKIMAVKTLFSLIDELSYNDLCKLNTQFSYDKNKQTMLELFGMLPNKPSKINNEYYSDDHNVNESYNVNGMNIVAPKNYSSLSIKHGAVYVDNELYFDTNSPEYGYYPNRNQPPNPKSCEMSSKISNNIMLNQENGLKESIGFPNENIMLNPINNTINDLEKKEENGMICDICLDNNRSILLDACLHCCLCEDCANQVIKGNKIICPKCRQENNSWRKIFL